MLRIVGCAEWPPQSVGVETVKRVQMEESTQFSKRFVTVEQMTKVSTIFSIIIYEFIKAIESNRVCNYLYVYLYGIPDGIINHKSTFIIP